MRRLLDVLRPEGIDPRSGEVRAPLMVHKSAGGAEDLYVRLTELTRQAIYEAKRLLQKETQGMALALLAYGEQFEDMVIRSESSDAEFRRLVDAYRDELWPEERSGPASATARIQRVVRLAQAVADALEDRTAAAAATGRRLGTRGGAA
jgi:hypothetical protein